MKINTLILSGAMLLMVSCGTTKQENLSYFSNLGTEKDGIIQSSDYEIKITPEDELLITVNSLIPEASASYNLPISNPSSRAVISTVNQPQQQTFIVDKNGNIQFPVLGVIKVGGLTTMQISEMLTKRIGEEVKDPYVRVELVNFKVNVMGEVKKPGTISVKTQRFSVLDALAEVQDLTEFGLRESVLLVREEENGTKSYHRLNLNDASLMSSPYFYLKQNDVIYVEPNKIRKDNSKYNQNNAYKLSVISTIVSAASVVASLIIALALK